MGTRLRAALAALLTFSVAASLSGCVPGGDDGGAGGAVDLVSSFSELGIAVTPFDGGDPVKPVTGTPVLAVTDWQVAQMQVGLPTLAKDGGYSIIGGVSLDELDAQVEATGEPSIDSVSARALILAWWRFAESPRADFARELMEAPGDGLGVVVPEAISTLFVADAMTDLQRPDAGPTAAGTATDERILAFGSGGVSSDPCGAIQKGIESVNQFLADSGPLGSIMKGAIDKGLAAADVASGGLGTSLKKIVSMLNMAFSITSLITHWDMKWSHDPNIYMPVGQNVDGRLGSVTLRISNPIGTLPANVSSCLNLLGITDPTSQAGAKVESTVHVGTAPDADFAEGLITEKFSPLPPEVDSKNEVNYNIASGTQINFDPAQKSREAYGFGRIETHIQRADVKKLTDWILGYSQPNVEAVLGISLPQLAESVTTLASLSSSEDVGVIYLIPDNSKPPVAPSEFEWEEGPIQNQSLRPKPGCVDPWKVEWITHLQVREHHAQTGDTVTASCNYRLSNGNWVGYTKSTYPADEAQYLTPAFAGLLPQTPDCFLSGKLEGVAFVDDAGVNTFIADEGHWEHTFVDGETKDVFFVWDGLSLSSVGIDKIYGPYPTESRNLTWSQGLAYAAGLCTPGYPNASQIPDTYDDWDYEF
ncbi:MAG: hypothetical protein ABI566_00495 [Pseudolysinimonas sp.]